MKKLLLSLSLISIGSFAMADDASPVYINVNTGISTYQALPTGEWTGNINAGYNFNKNFALEGGYNIFSGSQFGATTTASIFDVAAKGTIPLNDVFSLYGRAGLGFGINGWSGTPNTTNCELCQNNSSTYMLGLAGAGVSFALSRHFDLRLEDTLYIPFANTYAGSAINAVTGGVQYNF